MGDELIQKFYFQLLYIQIKYMMTHCKEVFAYFAISEPIFEIIISNWAVLSEVVNVLQTVYDATIDIQNANFTLSDFFCSWIRIQVRLQRMKSNTNKLTDLSDLLLESLQYRKSALLDHPAMLCAIFLDPRVHRELEQNDDAAKFKIAKLALANLNGKIVNLKENSSEIGQENENDSIHEYFNQQIDLDIDTEQDRRAQFLESLDHFHRSVMSLKVKLEKDQTIIDFWKKNNILFPALYDVTCVINAIPPSQATVERAFSTMKFVFGELRAKLNQERLEDILMIKLNGDLTESIDRNDLEKIRKKYSAQKA